MHEKTRVRIIARLIARPPIEWPAILLAFQKRHKWTPSDMDDLRRTLDDHAERCAFLSEYVSVRFGCTGCGEKNPADAVKHAQKRQTKVIKALGYYQQYRLPFFSSGSVPDETRTPNQPR